MKDMLNKIYEEIIECIRKEEIKKEKDVDVPFMSAALSRSLEKKWLLYVDMINDIHHSKKYDITYAPDDTGGYTYGKITIEMDESNISYEIQFLFDIGGIDEWDAPRVKVSKISWIDDFTWDQDETAYLSYKKKFEEKWNCNPKGSKESFDESSIKFDTLWDLLHYCGALK